MSKKNKVDPKIPKTIFEPQHVEFFQTVFAERENDLSNYYVPNKFLTLADNFESKKSFFIGRTGIGKTAILQKIKAKFPANAVLYIDPEDFAFTIMEKSQVLKELSKAGINFDLFYKTLWKYIFITEILKRRFGAEKKTWLKQSLDQAFDKPASKAYKFLLEHEELGEGRTFSEQISEIIRRMEHKIIGSFEKGGVKIGYEGTLNPQTAQLAQDALKSFEYTDLNYFIKVMDDEVMRNQKYVILVDDLDKNWIQNSVGINFTRCLFETIFDLNNTKSLRLLVSLRTNLFNQLKFHQSEKYMPYIEKMSWNDDELLNILEKRIHSMFPHLTGREIWKLFPEDIKLGSGKIETFQGYILDRSNRRPRDLLLLVSYMIKSSVGKKHITMDVARKAEQEYSPNRLIALQEEWSNPFLNIGFITEQFTGAKYKLNKTEMFAILDNVTQEVLVQLSNGKDSELKWIVEGQYIDANTFDNKNLLKLLYRIGFIGWRPHANSTKQFCFSQNSEEMKESVTDESLFYINPCYFSALHIQFSH